ncbi:TraR/DksA C4-type zinc finger protein [Fictibacillus terranigra]|uniref:TraR/DksA C4-type zinc finger protein n=1 Tax=Fictibacillus terranigra TaxID=3058424 RepID=A0ABT8E8H0_9BACL|nr:TraR/DksA C4-type zinc finger protein [Fictibacillus sp. CENA-BCM004]MDN4074222.1 TraR/DksA C4-type zinc finger protein [Fictibacillus sp. CENA-BCM004]
MVWSQQKISQFKDRLEQMQKELNDRLEFNRHYGNELELVKDSVKELSNYDNHPGDLGTELFERQKDIALNDLNEAELKSIQQALERIDAGEYGFCKTCGQPISAERLEALPTTAYCKEHSLEQTSSNDRPIEEEVLMPPYGKYDNDEKDATFYDAEDSWQDVAVYGTSETPSDFSENGMLNYNEMFVESEENVGYVEDIEGFIATDMDGSNTRIIPNKMHKDYERFLLDQELTDDDSDYV